MMLTDVATGHSAVTPVLGQKLGSPTCFNEFLTVLTGQGDYSPGNPEQTPGMGSWNHAHPPCVPVVLNSLLTENPPIKRKKRKEGRKKKEKSLKTSK